MDIVTRLKLFMDNSAISISQFADTCHIPRPTMSQLLNGRNKKVSDELISKIHQAYPSLSVLWLMFGEGEMFVNGNNGFSESQNSIKSDCVSTQCTDNELIRRPNTHLQNSSDNLHNKEEIENPMRFSENSHNTKSRFDYETAISDVAHGLIDFEHDFSAGNTLSEQLLNNEMEKPSTATTETFNQDISVKQPEIPSKCHMADSEDSREINSTVSEKIEANEISLHTHPNKRITNIVVFYSDNSFQSFIPANQDKC